ncbi:Protein of unknown function [Streptomyces sp. DvalAA-14]|uniref:hypothetical protein n=1 Tax=unclassified Streptomyces TaxID=2593676 RepID=UPI00081B5F97|nr:MULTISPECIES: hypothetical protein [unclassified Streptomyces]MYS20226.1 hypothetical protein [Streptomyces sp. SID4948]SCD63925.1 Protein of unknown function [Streptomyces sp. DvalAA-14]
MRITRMLSATVAVASLLLLGFVTAAPQAAAASGSACLSNPSEANCDGADPTDSNGVCQNGAYEVSSAIPVEDQNYGGGAAAVQVQLWWSPLCHTNWSRAVSTGYTGYFATDIWRQASTMGGVHQDAGHIAYGTDLRYGQPMWTSMLWAPGPAEACGSDQSTMVGGCTAWTTW